MKKSGILLSIILFLICAILHYRIVIVEILKIKSNTSIHSPIWLYGEIFCAILWTILDIKEVRKYFLSKDK